MFRDYKVTLLDRGTIARQAAKIRRMSGIAPNALKFDIVRVIETVFPKLFKGGLKIEFFKRVGEEPPAYVSFSPLTLHVDETVWALARAQHARSRFILAHEVGHLVLHEHQAMAFSSGREFQIKYSIEECSAEWQANVFAGYLLLPDEVFVGSESVDQLVEMCDVDENVATDRLNDIAAKRRGSRYASDGEACRVCGNFEVVRDGARVRCGSCGSVAPRQSSEVAAF